MKRHHTNSHEDSTIHATEHFEQWFVAYLSTYPIPRDVARTIYNSARADRAAEQKEDTQIVNFLCKHLDGVKWADVFPELRPRCGNDEYEEKYICASTFRKHLDAAALHAVDQPRKDLGSYEEPQ